MFKSNKQPLAALEIGEGYATAVRLEKGGGTPRISDSISVELPFRTNTEGNQWNAYTLDERFQDGINQIIEWLGKEKALSLVLPDMATRTFFINLENETGNAKEMRDLILFKVQKFAPVSTEGTTLDYCRLAVSSPGGEADYMVLLSSKSVVSSYEKYFAQRGIHIGSVEPASLASLELLGRAKDAVVPQDGSFALARIERAHFTITVFNNGNLVFMRTRVMNGGAASASRIAGELRTLRLFIADRLKAEPFDTVYFFGPGESLYDAHEEAAGAGFTSAGLLLSDLAEVPNELLQYESRQGRYFAATSAASRGNR